MKRSPVACLHLFHAQDTTKTVILRRGPSRTYRMILWDRADDTFLDGQWLKHKIYTERCDISPDGLHFLYFTLDGQWDGPSRGAYTVVCRPPYFTALRLYPQGETWGGGGYFLDSCRFYVATSESTPEIIGAEAPLERVFATKKTSFDSLRPSRLVDAISGLLKPKEKAEGRIDVDRPVSEADLYETEGHCLYRRNDHDRELIRDFSDMAFEPIIAPYGTPKDWRPLNGEAP